MNSKALCVLILLCSLACGNLLGQATQIREEFTFVNEQMADMYHVTSMDGGTMVMASTIGSLPAHSYITLIKLDSSGTEQWHKRFGPSDIRGIEIVQTPDSGYFFTAVDAYDDNKSYYTRVDQNGNVIFSRAYPMPSGFTSTYSYGGHALAKNDGGFYVTSTVLDSIANRNCWHLLELDNLGNVLWSKIYTGGNSAVYSIDTTANGDIVLGGSMAEPVTYKEFAVVLRTDSAGGIRWYNCYKSPIVDVGIMASDVDANDNIYVSAPYDAFMNSGNTTFLMKIDSAGNTIWSNQYVINIGIYPVFVRVTMNNEVVVAGWRNIMKLDTGGQAICARKHDALWMNSFDLLTDEKYSYTAQPWPTGDMLFYTSDSCGKTCMDSAMSFTIIPEPIYDSTLAGSAPLGIISSAYTWPMDTVTIYSQTLCTVVSVPEMQHDSWKLEVYPSPASDVLHIVSPDRITSVQIVNIAGQTVGVFGSETNEMDIEVSHFPAGIYFIEVLSGDEKSQVKFVVVHD